MDWIPRARDALARHDIDGWLLYDFRGSNPAARRFLPLPSHATRRIYLYVPARGDPTLIVSAIDAGSLPELPADVRLIRYTGRDSLLDALRDTLPQGPVALEYSPRNDVPYVSFVDAGTVELLRDLGVEPRSSAPILQAFDTWTDDQLQAHLAACAHVAAARAEAFSYIADRTASGAEVREAHVQDLIARYFDQRGLVYGHRAIVGFGPNSGDPHYAPEAGRDRDLRPGDAILIDLWCKLPADDAPYADVTWMGCFGAPSDELARAFDAVRDARDAALAVIRDAYASGRVPEGREADRAARRVIGERGYADAFRHRTGHSIGTASTHGNAAHLDDFETRDTRPLTPGFGITIEPGVYFASFGVRSEIDVYLASSGPRVTTEVQDALTVVPTPA